MHTCHFLKTIGLKKPPRARQAVLCSPCMLCGRWVCARPSDTACPSSLCTSSGWCPPTTAASCLEGPAGPAWRGKEGRLCPARPPGCPEGKGAWRAVEQRKRVSGKKRHFPSFLPLVFSPTFCSLIRSFLPLSSCFHTSWLSLAGVNRLLLLLPWSFRAQLLSGLSLSRR